MKLKQQEPKNIQTGAVRNYLQLLFAVLVWGSAYVVVRSAGQEMEPAALAFCRVAASVLFFLPFMLKARVPLREVWAARWYLLLMGLTGVAIFIFVMSFGLCHSTATNGSLINATNPIVMVFLAALFLKTKVKKSDILPLILAVAGAIILLLGKSSGNGLSFSVGDLAFVVNVFVWALFSILLVPFDNRLPGVVWGFWINLVGLVLLLPVMLWEGYDFTAMSGGSWLKVIYAGVFCGGIGTVFWGNGVSRLGVSTAALFNNLNPLFAVVLAVLVLGESLNGWQILGGVLILLAVGGRSVWEYRQSKRQNKQKQEVAANEYGNG